MNIRDMLSPEEREEYDAVLIRAGLDDSGVPRVSEDIGPRMYEMLLEADRSGRRWASWVIRDDAATGHLRRFNAWWKRENRHKVLHEGRLYSRAAVRGVKRRKETGELKHQLEFWYDMSWMDLELQIAEASDRIASERIAISTARKLLALRDDAPYAASPREAAGQLGVDLDAYIAGEQDVA